MLFPLPHVFSPPPALHLVPLSLLSALGPIVNSLGEVPSDHVTLSLYLLLLTLKLLSLLYDFL